MLLPKYRVAQGQVGRVVLTALPLWLRTLSYRQEAPSLFIAWGRPFTAARWTSNPNLSSSQPKAVRGHLTRSIQQEINGLRSGLPGRRVNLVF